MTENDFALVSDERDHDAALDHHRAGMVNFRLEQSREELTEARRNLLRMRGAAIRNCGSDLTERRQDVILFYGRLARRETAIRAAISVVCEDALHWALCQEVAWDEDTLESEEFASIDPLDALADHLSSLISKAKGETADWRAEA